MIFTAFCFVIENAAGQEKSKHPLPDILVVRDGWQANQATVKKVLDSTAADLWKHFPNRKLPPIIVYPKKGPVTLYQRGPNKEIFIRLDTGKTYWAQYAYQFSHEFCHVLCEYDRDPHGNRWFEESICELASLYTLRQMGETWKTKPPFDHWKEYAKHLKSYAEDRISQSTLKNGESLSGWFEKHADTLYANATRRELNLVVATRLLPLFEKDPSQWQAVGYLNKAKPKSKQTFQQYLSDWHFQCPKVHRPFVMKIAEEFDIELVIRD